MKAVLKLSLVLVAGYAVVCLALFLLQRRLLYFPGPAPGGSPASNGLVGEALTLETEDGESLGAWWIEPQGAAPRGALLVSHGNAGNLEQRASLARTFCEMNFAVLLYDYRGYGASSGRPHEPGLRLDARAAYRWLRERGFEPERIVLYGESLGGGVATQLASEVPAAALILESSFTSVADVASALYPWLPTRLLLRDRYENLRKIETLELPLLVVHSPDDELIPCAHARRLAAAAAHSELLETRGGHNDGGFRTLPEACAGVRAFLERCVRAAGD